MARPVGLEPTTPRFEAWCSIQLNYGRVGAESALSAAGLASRTERIRDAVPRYCDS